MSSEHGATDQATETLSEIVALLRRLNAPLDERRDAISRIDAYRVRGANGQERTWLQYRCYVAARKLTRWAIRKWNLDPNEIDEEDIELDVYMDFTQKRTNATEASYLNFCDDADPVSGLDAYLNRCAHNRLVKWWKAERGPSLLYELRVGADTIDASTKVLREALGQLRLGTPPSWLLQCDGLPATYQDLVSVIERLVSDSNEAFAPDAVQVSTQHLLTLIRAAVKEAQARRRVQRRKIYE